MTRKSVNNVIDQLCQLEAGVMLQYNQFLQYARY